jgi:hypothetical protein
MLGERLGGGTGKITGTRVLPSEGQQVWLEAALQGEGTVLGQPVMLLASYRQTPLGGGTLRGEGKVLFLAADGGLADTVTGGTGHMLGAGFATSYGWYGSAVSAQGSLAQLAEAAIVGEYEIAADGSATWEMWAWTGARVPMAAGAR